ncbi:uncharacterized protein Z518_02031 [Rhinocladiella mackenziei CBS 650.93]|uniref:Uncharacterized protein n=1 Tax=Rhinocladiella mackenziei CBS 650.93 TaxID=1442369 RepID=A0A0D2HA73_9EURO|nr:uncharacterized protein Z518_02031 [Rhinocladiella mackenziei CBS 650.93]KIX07378.1 hypothetical protein Z518_02031 [Rhinocladiella mackenziei CBS 650.93]
MSSPTWQDRRFIGTVPKEIHQGSRRYSATKDTMSTPPTAATALAAATIPTTSPADSTTPATKVFPTWEGDRRFMGTVPKEIHEPARKSSFSGAKPAEVPKPASASPPPASTGGGIAAAIAGRRRSSAGSQSGMFSGLLANRSNDQRRQSWEDVKKPEGLGGFFSGLVNSKPAEKK